MATWDNNAKKLPVTSLVNKGRWKWCSAKKLPMIFAINQGRWKWIFAKKFNMGIIMAAITAAHFWS